ncbi:TonB-dependent receptor [Proteiniphilum saccharofermentans]|uniref:TonB-dependent receptor n=1 Tax=Proteiniphilum saccharofermentans TaxID=1642647 RepID=UPI0028B0B974|nr:TonB-dependent receptor [Proteiniphilum saccharofermentans]
MNAQIKRIGISCLLLLLLNIGQSIAQISISATNTEINNVLRQIEEKSDYTFFYSDNFLDLNQKVTIQAKDETIENILNRLFRNTNIGYRINNKQIALSEKSVQNRNRENIAQQQGRTITGKVIDENGDPVIGANIIEKGTTNGTVTDVDGNFSLRLEENAILHISYIGYLPQDITTSDKMTFNIVLEEDTKALEELVVIGYGTARKIDLTGSISSLSGDKLQMKSTPQLSSQLQGQMAGVQITRSNGDPSAGATIRVRGVTTMSTNDPLVIVDGIPGTLTNIAPEDVKDIQVLKDAASAAIYGSRAAAGVILVTTKRARNNEFHLSYNGEYGINAPTAKPKFANAVQWMSGLNELAFNDGASSPHSLYSEDLINNYAQLRAEDPDRYADTDFMDLGLKSSTHHQRHSLSLSGGTDKLKTNFSFNYYDSEALIDTKNYERFNIRTNNDYTINNWINANVDLNLLYSNANEPHLSMAELMERAPIYNAYWSDGRFADGKDGDNPIAQRDLSGSHKKQNYRVGGKLQLVLTPIEGLALTAIVAPQYSFYKGKDHRKRYEVYRITGDPIPGVGYSSTSLSEARNDNHSLTKQFYANYNLQLKRHSIGLMAGYEDYFYKWEEQGASRTNYSLVNFPYLDLGPEDYQFNSGKAGHNAYRSFFGRIMYSWADRYLLQANIRSDGSSRFAKGHRWGTFPSVSAGWVISEEPWFNKSVVDFLKLRGSIGQLGNERIGSEFPYQARLSFGTGFIPNASTGVSDIVQTAYQMDYAFKDLTWETTTTYGIGADISLLKNNLRASVDYYYKKTTDMLMEVGFPSYFGYNAPQKNAADMNTTGWDFEISWNDRIRDFHYGVSFNLYDYRSKMGYMADRQRIDDNKITEEGSYYNEWYGYKSMGIILNEKAMLDENGNQIPVLTNNDKAGNIRYQDIDGDGKITASNDRVRLGNSLPELQYGGSLWAEWKGIDFNLSFQGIGHQLSYWSWPGTPFNYQAYASPLNLIESHWSPTATDEENAKAKYPKLTTNSANIYARSDFYLFNGAYMRIKNITLGYTLPSEITKKLSVNKLRVYFSANDLPAFSKYPKGYDPEWGRSGDLLLSSYIFGLNVSF